jgi:acyl-CoA synthetase (AMP-forming)/AMP-acid ligase II
MAYQVGNCLVAMDRIDPEGLAEWVRTEKVSSFASVPTVLRDLLTHPSVTPEDLASLESPGVGGADCPEEFRDLYRERYGREVAIGYGMTEAPTTVAMATESSPVPGICGKALPQIEITIRDEANQLLPSGEVGEICVGPSQSGSWAGIYTPMLGYWDKPEASAEALAGGVYHSGDLGVLDEQGTLFIRGRRQELILRGGANVYPAEVERVLQDHPAVAVAAVLGVPDERLGQRVVAAVQLEPDASLEGEGLVASLAAHCGKRLARYKLPADYRVVEQFPRNAMNKIVKPRLVELFA